MRSKYVAGMLRMNGMRRTQSKYKPLGLSITRNLITRVFDLSRKHSLEKERLHRSRLRSVTFGYY